MDGILIVLLTAAVVSVDSFVCGCGLGKSKGLAPVVAAVTLFMCLLFQLLGEALSRIADAQLLGAALLALIGLNTIVKKEETLSFMSKLSGAIKGEGIGAAFSVAVDGALGAFSLAALGYNGIICSIAVALFHYLFFLLGEKIGSFAGGGRARNIAGGIALIALSVTKLL